MKLIFWLAVFLLGYNYLIFPVLMVIYSSFKNKPVKKGKYTPEVTLLISAYKEERIIRDKIENSLKLAYPKEKLEIIVATDGDEDRTANIVSEYRSQGVVLSHRNERGGKVAAINRGVKIAKGEIIILSDANSMYNPDALIEITSNFADSTIGGVTGRKSISTSNQRASTKGDHTYWRYESIIKHSQSRIGSISTADGEIFGFRKALYCPIPEYIINDDTAITFDIVRQGYRVIYEPLAISTELASQNLIDDYYVKVRMVAGGYQSIVEYAKDLIPPKTFFSIQFLSHKLLRWMAPIFLLFIFFTNFFLLHGIYILFLVGQLCFYGFAGAGMYKIYCGKSTGLFYFPLYFVVMNSAAFVGMLRYVCGNSKVTKIWKRAER